MKKIAIILSMVFVASIVSSCVPKFEYTIPLAVDNLERTWPKNGNNAEDPIDYVQITSSGTWEAKLTPATEGESWCWIEDHYVDKKGNKVKVAEYVEFYEGTERCCKVRGTGTVWLPIHYMQSSFTRYATLNVRRVDADVHVVMRITQK